MDTACAASAGSWFNVGYPNPAAYCGHLIAGLSPAGSITGNAKTGAQCKQHHHRGLVLAIQTQGPGTPYRLKKCTPSSFRTPSFVGHPAVLETKLS